jgi:hypothetical protein
MVCALELERSAPMNAPCGEHPEAVAVQRALQWIGKKFAGPIG